MSPDHTDFKVVRWTEEISLRERTLGAEDPQTGGVMLGPQTQSDEQEN